MASAGQSIDSVIDVGQRVHVPLHGEVQPAVVDPEMYRLAFSPHQTSAMSRQSYSFCSQSTPSMIIYMACLATQNSIRCPVYQMLEMTKLLLAECDSSGITHSLIYRFWLHLQSIITTYQRDPRASLCAYFAFN